MIEILMYLFENYMENDASIYLTDDQLIHELKSVGYMDPEIAKALTWLQGLQRMQKEFHFSTKSDKPLRTYHAHEAHYFGRECRALLLQLEQADVITAPMREIIIDRAMALGHHEITVDRLRWVILMVVFSHPSNEHALTWIQDFMLSKPSDVSH